MSQGIPESVDPDDEIEIQWSRQEGHTEVTASLGGASVVVKTSHESAPTVPWLVAALPQILEAAWAAIETEESKPQEAP